MSRNGSGTYTWPAGSFNPAVSGSQATPSDWNTGRTDLEGAMSTSIANDGQTTITANLPMSTFRHTGVGNASARTMYAAAGQIADNALTYAIDTGAADAYVITLAPAITAYVVGQTFYLKIINANLTTTPTLNVNGVGAGTITWPNGSALAAGDLPANALIEVIVSALTPVYHLQTVSIPAVGLSGNQTVTGNKTFSGTTTLTTAVLGTASTATTQAQGSNDTKLATDAYVDRVAVQQVVSTITGAVATGTTVISTNDTIPQNTAGDQYMSLAITPKSTTSKLIINVVWNGSSNLGGGTQTIALFQDSTANALAAVAQAFGGAGFLMNFSLVYEMTSGTTSATTFKVRSGTNSAATTTFNGVAAGRIFGGVMASSITITEIGF